jgi:formamidopyrimidine-DNA glycosylase
MPELPEVETVGRALRPQLLGRSIRTISAHIESLRHPLTLQQDASLCGAPVAAVTRRAKYLTVALANGRGILLHLGMTGHFRIEPADSAHRKHDRLEFFLDNDQVWRFNDIRRFGIAKAVNVDAAGNPLEGLPALGPEPWDPAWGGAALHTWLSRRIAAIKPLIMDPRCVVGVGNIYASEALHRARISPTRPGKSLSRKACDRLVCEVRKTLEEAIEAGGTTISDFRGVDGSEGSFEQELLVYGRADAPCLSCEEGTILRSVQGGRATYSCAKCQR